MKNGTSVSRSHKVAYLCLVAVYFLWGSTFIGVRLAVQTVPPFVVGVLRHGFGGIALLGYLALKRDRGAFGSRTQIINALKAGVFTTGLSNACLTFVAINVPSGISAVAFTTLPFFMLLLNWKFFEKVVPSRSDWGGIALGLTGSVLVASTSASLSGGALGWFDYTVLALAPLCWAIGALYGRRVSMPPNILASAAVQVLSGALFQATAGLIRGDWAQFATAHVSAVSWAGVIYLAVGGSLLGYTAFAMAIRSLDPRVVGTYAFMNPVVALTLGLIFGERLLTPYIMLGSCMCLGGVAVMLLGSWHRARVAKRLAVMA